MTLKDKILDIMEKDLDMFHLYEHGKSACSLAHFQIDSKRNEPKLKIYKDTRK